MTNAMPQVPFGAVYFRKSNPPQEDWQRDYGVAAQDGLNVFRHWFMWSAIEQAPGVFVWDDYDRQMDLAAAHGIKTIIAEMSQSAPEWALRTFAHARQRRVDGQVLPSVMSPSSSTGGFARNGGGVGTLTLNCPQVRAAAETFLTTLADRYKGHPALLGYDIWNECNYSPLVDYGEHARAAFREWLKAKYGTLEALGRAWFRYSFAEWEDVQPPTQAAPYPEGLDWLKFKKDNHYEQMQFRIDTIRRVDADCLIAAHGVAGAVTDMAARGCDDWLAASKVQVYGYTWIAARKGAQPWRNFFAADLVRGASRGKMFWHAERQGGPLWMQPQVLGRDKDDGRVAEPEDIRLWALSSFAGGAKGMMNLRYRPLLDGPLFGAFGSYGMDGSRTPRSEIASAIAKWTNDPAQAEVFAANPVAGDIGILVVPDVQEFDYLLSAEGKFDTYAAAMWGAYRGFFDNNIQADWVHIDDMDAYDALYFPYPIMFTQAQATRITEWVARGGTLIAEACPGYFGDRGRAGTVQPNMGLDEVFGVREHDVEFMPDISDRNRFTYEGLDITCGGFLQSYVRAGGTARGDFDDGRLAVVEHRFGDGKTLLIGTHPSVSYYRTTPDAGRRFFARLFDWTGKRQHVATTNPKIQARLHTGTAPFIWIVNPTRTWQTGKIVVEGAGDGWSVQQVHWGADTGHIDGDSIAVGPRDALVARIG